jgi:hypothetical protein
LPQDAVGSRRLVAFNAKERGQDNRINVFEYDDSLKLLLRCGDHCREVAREALHQPGVRCCAACWLRRWKCSLLSGCPRPTTACRTEFELPGAAFGFFHDFVLTPNYYVFLESPSECQRCTLGCHGCC